ncbi:metallophosphoesterase family protein [Aureimonas psammosilenae]|uniref:metallophosphoesterase family protein n=1 Tax=Aureimonas psammosilenae TaxID=2495496 RepID=UPI0012609305|nr:metallophosphoesterase family protein [Aureimonas psammosilenae]
MTVFFTADQHFGHARIIELCRRPFGSVDEMDEAMVAAWNAVVQPGDVVWHLGDFAYRSARHPGEILDRLHGTKHLVVGNHDSARTREMDGWASVQESAEVSDGGTRLFLSHYPHLEWPAYFRQAVHLFGHVHGNRAGVGRSCDVGVDCWGYRPVRLPEILDRIGDAQNV